MTAAFLAFCEGIWKLQALEFLSISILRSSKKVSELANDRRVLAWAREVVVMMDIRQFTNVWV